MSKLLASITSTTSCTSCVSSHLNPEQVLARQRPIVSADARVHSPFLYLPNSILTIKTVGVYNCVNHPNPFLPPFEIPRLATKSPRDITLLGNGTQNANNRNVDHTSPFYAKLPQEAEQAAEQAASLSANSTNDLLAAFLGGDTILKTPKGAIR